MTSDDTSSTAPEPADPQSQGEVESSDSNELDDGTGQSEATQHGHGSPRPRSFSLDDLRRETGEINAEATQRVLQNFYETTVPLLQSQLRAGVKAAIEASKHVQSIRLTVADAAAKTFKFRDDWSRYVAQQLKDVLETVQRLPVAVMRSWGPPNWSNLTDDEVRSLPATALAGIPVAWVPRTAILRELIAAPDHAAQLVVIGNHESEIVDDCSTAVTQTRTGSFGILASAVAEAIAVHRAGHRVASQALSASVLDTLFRTFILSPTRPYYPKLKTQIKGQSQWMPDVIAQLPALRALEDFDSAQIPTVFNRHASAHAVSVEQYSDTNALVSLMLATSLLRDAHHVEHELPDEDEVEDGTDIA